eukprot:TRINITY_DN4397_c0_g1_i1.p1 TRINITY_DN4397_c0_g1~~TRINITY_DN4397_c0_g1_i1.p1  ORF type:complete len:444 (-),score=23.65 TRINITY_DN4397_c0_g1_i1:880-2211(-)
MSNWLDPSILLSEDIELILQANQSLGLDRLQIQKYAAYYLSKTYAQENNVSWGSIASRILVFYATSFAKDDQVDAVKFLSAHPQLWLDRIKLFRRATKKKQVARDCLHQLFKTNILSIDEIATDPSLLAALAHRVSVQEFMSFRISGLSPVAHVLQVHDKSWKSTRLEFFESLYQAYKSDFNIISPNFYEFKRIVECEHSRVLSFFKKVGAKFRAMDFALSYLPEAFKTALERHYVPEERSWPPKTGLQKVINTILVKKGRERKNPTEVLRELTDHSTFLERAYKQMCKANSELKGKFSADSEFPLDNLPREIIENIITINDEMVVSIRALFCVSRRLNAIKANIKWREYLKRQYPLKYHNLEKSLARTTMGVSSFDWNGYYMKHNKYDTNRRECEFTELRMPWRVYDINEDIYLGYDTSRILTDQSETHHVKLHPIDKDKKK